MAPAKAWMLTAVLLFVPEAVRAQPMNLELEYKECGNCRQKLPDHIGVGDTCPHCGVYFAREVSDDPEADADTDRFALKFLVGIVLLVGLLGGGGFVAATYYHKQQQARWDEYMAEVKKNKPKRRRPKKQRDPNWI